MSALATRLPRQRYRSTDPRTSLPEPEPSTRSASPNVVELMDDHVFGKVFDADSWLPWKVLLKAILGYELTGYELALYRYHTQRAFPPGKLVRESAWICGRRAGKSMTLAALAVAKTLEDYSQSLGPGEVACAAVVAGDRDQAKTILSYARGLLQSSDMLADELEDDLAETLILRNKNEIKVFTASISAPRGRTFCLVAAEECAFWKSESSKNLDAEILSACRPGMLTLPTSQLVLASSVYAKRGILWDAYNRHFGRDDAKVLCWLGTTTEMHNTVDMSILEDEFEKDRVRADAEYNCIWRVAVDDFVSWEIVNACTVRGRYQLPFSPGLVYTAAVDMSGGVSDAAVLSIGHRDGDLAVQDLIEIAEAPHSPSAAVERFCAILKQYKIHTVIGDNYSGETIKEQFRARGVMYRPAPYNRSDAFVQLLPLLSTRRAQLLDHKRIGSELTGLERRTGSSGKDTVTHGPSRHLHDDVANATALCLVAVGTGSNSLALWDLLGRSAGPIRRTSATNFWVGVF